MHRRWLFMDKLKVNHLARMLYNSQCTLYGLFLSYVEQLGVSGPSDLPLLFKCPSPSSIPLIATRMVGQRGSYPSKALQSPHFYFLFPRQISRILGFIQGEWPTPLPPAEEMSGYYNVSFPAAQGHTVQCRCGAMP